MGKIDIEFIPDSRQGSVGCVQQGICGKVIRRPEPFAPEYSPKCLCKIEMRAVWWEKEEKQSSLFPNGSKLLHELTLSRTTNVSLQIQSESRSIKSAILSAVMFSVVENPSYLLLRSIIPKRLSLRPLSEGKKRLKKTLLSKILEPFLTCWGVQINNHSHNHNRNHRKNKYSSIHNLMF